MTDSVKPTSRRQDRYMSSEHSETVTDLLEQGEWGDTWSMERRGMGRCPMLGVADDSVYHGYVVGVCGAAPRSMSSSVSYRDTHRPGGRPTESRLHRAIAIRCIGTRHVVRSMGIAACTVDRYVATSSSHCCIVAFPLPEWICFPESCLDSTMLRRLLRLCQPFFNLLTCLFSFSMSSHASLAAGARRAVHVI